MKLQKLIAGWQEQAADPRTLEAYAIRLPVYDAARIAALAEIYPGRTETQIITELLNVILDEIEERLPYEQGSNVIGEDEMGDPIYEDIGPTPRFRQLTEKNLQKLNAEIQQATQ